MAAAAWEGRGCAGMRRRTEAGWKCVCFMPIAGGPKRTSTCWVGNTESTGMAVIEQKGKDGILGNS
jgi:hypothetical protein